MTTERSSKPDDPPMSPLCGYEPRVREILDSAALPTVSDIDYLLAQLNLSPKVRDELLDLRWGLTNPEDAISIPDEIPDGIDHKETA